MRLVRDWLAGLGLIAALAACGGTHPQVITKHATTTTTPTVMTTMTTNRANFELLAYRRARARWFNVALWNDTVRWNRAATRHPVENSAQGPARPPLTPDKSGAAVAAPSSIAGVMQCIKNHESGNYTEATHPSSGSGAYQYVPGTWQTWSARAGYPGYSYAYLAPASVQDAVTVYTLTHGGAGNWSPRYGDDPCTVGMGG